MHKLPFHLLAVLPVRIPFPLKVLPYLDNHNSQLLDRVSLDKLNPHSDRQLQLRHSDSSKAHLFSDNSLNSKVLLYLVEPLKPSNLLLVYLDSLLNRPLHYSDSSKHLPLDRLKHNLLLFLEEPLNSPPLPYLDNLLNRPLHYSDSNPHSRALHSSGNRLNNQQRRCSDNLPNSKQLLHFLELSQLVLPSLDKLLLQWVLP